MMENAKRNPRTIALEKNRIKPSGEPAWDPNTGAPCPHDQVKGSYKKWGQGSASSSASSGEQDAGD